MENLGSADLDSYSTKRKICFLNHHTKGKIFYKVGLKTEMQTFLKNYCKESELEYGEVTFLLNGKRIPLRGTVEQAGFKDEDVIDVMVHASGGGPSK